MSRGEDGFTLLEVLVAAAILAVGLAGFYQAFGIGLRGEAAAERQYMAAEAAETLLAEIGRTRPLLDGTTSGELPEGERWTLRVEPMGPPASDGAPWLLEGHLATLDVVPPGGGTALRVQTVVLGIPGE